MRAGFVSYYIGIQAVSRRNESGSESETDVFDGGPAACNVAKSTHVLSLRVDEFMNKVLLNPAVQRHPCTAVLVALPRFISSSTTTYSAPYSAPLLSGRVDMTFDMIHTHLACVLRCPVWPRHRPGVDLDTRPCSYQHKHVCCWHCVAMHLNDSNTRNSAVSRTTLLAVMKQFGNETLIP